MGRRSMIWAAVAMLAATALLGACGSGSKSPVSGSASPVAATSTSSLGTPAVVLGGALSTNNPQGGALKGRAQPGAYLTVHVTEGSLLFVVQTMPTTAVFRCKLYALPQLREVRVSLAVKSNGGFKTYYVRPSGPLAPGPYQLVYGGVGRFQMTLYEGRVS